MCCGLLDIGETYTKIELYEVPQTQQGGKWSTGYLEHEGDFANIGIPGWIEHDYDNHLVGSELSWQDST